MTDLRLMNEQRRDRGRWGAGGPRDDDAPRKPEPRRDAGAYIGRMPERATETIPGGVGRKDVRTAAVASQPAPVRQDPAADTGAPPQGHREAAPADDDAVKEAGKNR
jgi:hypothetical protein